MPNIEQISKVEKKEKLFSKLLKHDSNDGPFVHNNVAYQKAASNDVSDMMILEQKWPPNLRATEDQIRRRVDLFPDGAIIARIIQNNREKFFENELGEVVGMITSQRVLLSEEEQKSIGKYSWNELTGDGKTPKIDPEGNTADLIGLIVHDQHQNKQIGTILFLTAMKSFALLSNPEIDTVTANVRLPEFKKWHDTFKKTYNHDLSVKEYISLFRDSDPVLRIHCGTGGGDVSGWETKGQTGDYESMEKGARIDHSRLLSIIKNRLNIYEKSFNE